MKLSDAGAKVSCNYAVAFDGIPAAVVDAGTAPVTATPEPGESDGGDAHTTHARCEIVDGWWRHETFHHRRATGHDL